MRLLSAKNTAAANGALCVIHLTGNTKALGFRVVTRWCATYVPILLIAYKLFKHSRMMGIGFARALHNVECIGNKTIHPGF